MNSAAPSSPFRDPHDRIARSFIWPAAIGLFCGWVTQASASKAQTGQWSPQNSPVNFSIVHMALLPGGGSYHSRIVVWDYTDIHSGAEFGWNAGAAGCDDWPYSLVRLDTLWNPSVHVDFAGHALLATSGALLTVGGEDGLNNLGIPDALKLTPGSGASQGTWSAGADMQQSRQCPTLTPLRDGRMLVTGGLRYQHEWYFGGRVDGNPPTGGTGDSLSRFGSGTKRVWDRPVKPDVVNSLDRPTPREGHTAVNFLSDAGLSVAFFGGKNASGITTDNDVYLLKREDIVGLDADYTYRWSKLPVGGSLIPPARSDHVAIERPAIQPGTLSQMVIYGGLSQPSGGPTTVLGDFWKLSYDASNLVWSWSPLSQTGTSPGPRYGQSAAMYGGKMYVFGGSGAFNAEPTDNHVYEFTFSTGSWRDVPLAAGPAPEPRRDHAMVTVGAPYSSVLMYGGYLSTSASSATLWKLVPGDSARWSVIATDGSSPGPRMNHTAFYDGSGGGRLTIFGGDPPRGSDPPVDNRAYSLRPFAAGTGNATWVQEPAAQHRLSGHTVVSDPFEVLHARIPEIYNPDSDTWTAQTGSGWMPPSDVIREYPVQFLVPGSSIPGGGGRVLRVGQDPKTRYLDVPATGLAGAWHEVATNVISGDMLHPVTGVQYLPGKILVAGDGPETDDPAIGPGTHRHARTFDATAIGTATWVDADPQHLLMQRPNVNLLVLPNGKVMILGANRPQIWDPSNGSWTDPLDSEGFDRGYRSTAVLLPDGRVLTGGGFGGGGPVLKVFCPPYLFKADGSLAPRPQISGAPASVTWRKTFTVCVADTTGIRGACFLRPAATTHGFDQNQRFAPLTITGHAGNPQRVFLTAPASPDSAPPGDYLLFLIGANDGATAYPDVPSIAQWVRLGPPGLDLCDQVDPGTITSLSPDIISSHEIWFVWTATADDSVFAASGLEQSFDLRGHTVALNSSTWGDAVYLSTDESEPPSVGNWGTGHIEGLGSCTSYHFAVRARDDNNQQGGFSDAVFQTSCGGGGEGYSAREVHADGAESPGSASGIEGASAARSPSGRGSAASASAGSLQPETGLLIVETRREPEGAWRVTLHLQQTPTGTSPPITVEQSDAGGARDTLTRFEPGEEDNVLGLCALRDRGRLGIPGVYRIEEVVSHLHSPSGDQVLTAALHSRLGALGGEFLTAGGPVDMAIGDSLVLTYGPAAEALTDAASWYVLVRRTGDAPPTPMGSHRGQLGEVLPTRFALHSSRPNPAGEGGTVIAFDLPIATPVSLEVFDLLGRRVASLAEGAYPAGFHTATWDLRDANGSVARPGVYVYRLIAGEFRERRKMSVLR